MGIGERDRKKARTAVDQPQTWTLSNAEMLVDVMRVFRAREKALEYATQLFSHHTSFAIEDVVLRAAVKFEDYLLNGNHPA